VKSLRDSPRKGSKELHEWGRPLARKGGETQAKKTIDFPKMKRDNGLTVSCKKSLLGSQKVTKGLLILL
jgi:hypothetical protein